MPVNTSGAELKAFYDDEAFWPENVYHDDVAVSVDGVEMGEFDIDLVPSDSKVKILCGYVQSEDFSMEPISFEGYFKKWRKKQKVSYLMVKVDQARRDEVVCAIKAAGGVIV